MNTKEKLVYCLEQIGIVIDADEDIDENILEYGLDSLSYIHLICAIEELFQIEIPDQYLISNGMLTLRSLILMVENG